MIGLEIETLDFVLMIVGSCLKILLLVIVLINVLMDIGEIRPIWPVYLDVLMVSMDMKELINELVILQSTHLLIYFHFLETRFLHNL